MKRMIFFIATIALIAVVWWVLYPKDYGSADFPIVSTRHIYNVDDAGIGDLNGDGRMDRWTTNHSAAQWIDLTGAGTNDAVAAGLTQDADLPGFAQGDLTVPDLKPVRIYMDHTEFVIESDGLGGALLQGRMIVPWDLRTETRGGAAVTVEPCDIGPYCKQAIFSVPDGGQAIIEPIPAPSDGFEIEFVLEQDVPLDQVQLGALALTPPAHQFSYASKDRHGLALAALGSDETTSVFVSRGGIRGELLAVGPDDLDELFTWNGSEFVDVIGSAGITKDGCSGRQTAWIDIDDDGLLDLYQVCGRSNPPGDTQANRLYRQTALGIFEEVGQETGFALPGLGSFRFFRNPVADAPLSMLWAGPDNLTLFDVIDGALVSVWELPKAKGNFDKIIVVDIDGDGALEALVFSPGGTLAVDLSEQEPTLWDVRDLGLPPASVDGVYLDINADGLRDMFLLPQGLFLGTSDGFVQSDAIDLDWLGMTHDVRFAWFDADGDADLDLWLIKRGGDRANRTMRFLYNRAPEGVRGAMESVIGLGRLRERYWLSLVFENRIAMTGSHQFVHVKGSGGPVEHGFPVRVTTIFDGEAREALYVTGEADSSRFSQTMGLLYVPLPAGAELSEVEILAPEPR